MMRDVVWDALRNDPVLNGLGIQPNGSNIHQAETVDSLPIKPALVIRWDSVAPRLSDQKLGGGWIGAGTQGLQVWVHDEIGTYDLIDLIIERVRVVIGGLRGIGEFIQADWAGDSPDLRDDGYNTLTRHSDWTIAQGWR